MESFLNLLHIYPQYAQHIDVCIAGNREGLEALRDAIERTLSFINPPCSSKVGAFVGDGEGFACHVIRIADTDFDSLAVPYISEYASETRPDAVPPWKYIRKEK